MNATTLSGQFEMRVMVAPDRVRQVRRILVAHLSLWGRQDLSEDAAIAVSELLTNVHKHVAPPECVLVVQRIEDGICVTVSDRSAIKPTVQKPDWESETGRGLFLLAQTAHEWGVATTATGKDVWFSMISSHKQHEGGGVR